MRRPAVLLASLLALLVAAPTGEVAAADPSLAITLSDGVEEAGEGDTLDYVATVENRGGEAFEGIVSIVPPPHLTLTAEDAVETDGALSWPVTIPAGGRAEVEATGAVGTPAEGDYQLVVTATVVDADRPEQILVRAADADRIPGTEAPPPVPGLTEPAAAWTPDLPVAAVLGALLLATAVVVVIVVVVRRRRTT